MVDKATHDDYIKLYKELVNRINQKEDIIQQMSIYISKYIKKHSKICKYNNKIHANCEHKKCTDCVREYFEKRGSRN